MTLFKELPSYHLAAGPHDRALSAARAYIDRGWNPVPLPFMTKKPVDDAWPNRVIGRDNVCDYFKPEPMNVGVVLGPTSQGLTDVDLDCPEAIDLASYMLPRTGAIFGRASARASHRLYRTTLAGMIEKATLRFNDPTPGASGRTVLVELRVGPGAQTVFPGSVHETGEAIGWEEQGEPAAVGDDDLLRRIRRLAAACLFARYWPQHGRRHDSALALGGFLTRAGVPMPDLNCMVEAVAKTAGDSEWRDRLRAAKDAADAFRQGKRAFGYPEIERLFGLPVATAVANWLDYHRNGEATPTATNCIVTEDSAARQFVQDHGPDLRYCHSHGAWFRWNGVYWALDETGVAFHWARVLARRLAEDEDDRRRYITSKTSFAAGVEKFAKVDPDVAVTIGHWDRDPWLLGTPGGTVDLRTGISRPSSRDDGITRITSVAPSATGCPLWLKFLNEATGDDAELIRFLQQWCGYCLTGTAREHALVFVYGTGGNGKGVFLNVLMSIMDDYGRTAAMETFTASSSDRHPTDLAMLRGARLVAASETEEGRAWAEARIKALTGGDRISARFMRQDFFEYTPQFKLIVIGNHKPTLHNVDEAARRRFNIVPFVRRPSVPDRELEKKLLAEAPAILQWMIDGCNDWQRNGLLRPQCVVEATEAYFSDQDLFKHWLEEECICEPGNIDRSTASSVLFRSWSDFAKPAGGKPGMAATFKDNMIAAGFKYYRGPKAREFFGISLSPKPGLGSFP
jgi:putative DNA primase/helicase